LAQKWDFELDHNTFMPFSSYWNRKANQYFWWKMEKICFFWKECGGDSCWDFI